MSSGGSSSSSSSKPWSGVQPYLLDLYDQGSKNLGTWTPEMEQNVMGTINKIRGMTNSQDMNDITGDSMAIMRGQYDPQINKVH